jgi:hypothetical protein
MHIKRPAEAIIRKLRVCIAIAPRFAAEKKSDTSILRTCSCPWEGAIAAERRADRAFSISCKIKILQHGPKPCVSGAPDVQKFVAKAERQFPATRRPWRMTDAGQNRKTNAPHPPSLPRPSRPAMFRRIAPAEVTYVAPSRSFGGGSCLRRGACRLR